MVLPGPCLVRGERREGRVAIRWLVEPQGGLRGLESVRRHCYLRERSQQKLLRPGSGRRTLCSEASFGAMERRKLPPPPSNGLFWRRCGVTRVRLSR